MPDSHGKYREDRVSSALQAISLSAFKARFGIIPPAPRIPALRRRSKRDGSLATWVRQLIAYD